MFSVGEVIEQEGKYYVITLIINGKITQKVPLKDFVSKNFVIRHEGEYKTVDEIVEDAAAQYLEHFNSSGAQLVIS